LVTMLTPYVAARCDDAAILTALSNIVKKVFAHGEQRRDECAPYPGGMAIGGRSRIATAIGTVIVLAVIALLVWAALPFFPAVGDWLDGIFFGFFDWLRSGSAE
ncbi:MAG: hypothetical protein ACTHVH_10960, partial [Microbacterium gubbeenense]